MSYGRHASSYHTGQQLHHETYHSSSSQPQQAQKPAASTRFIPQSQQPVRSFASHAQDPDFTASNTTVPQSSAAFSNTVYAYEQQRGGAGLAQARHSPVRQAAQSRYNRSFTTAPLLPSHLPQSQAAITSSIDTAGPYFGFPPTYDSSQNWQQQQQQQQQRQQARRRSSHNQTTSDPQPPPPPSHSQQQQREQQYRGAIPAYDPQSPAERVRSLGYSNSIRTNSTITPGADNLGETAAGGGIAGIAYGVASANERESGVLALKALQEQQKLEPGYQPGYSDGAGMDFPREDNPYVPEPRGYRRRDGTTPSAALGAVRSEAFGPVAAGAASTAAAGGMAAPRADHQYDLTPWNAAGNPTTQDFVRVDDDNNMNLGHQGLTPPELPQDPFGSRASLAPSLPEDAFAGGFPPSRRSLPPLPHGVAASGGAAAGAALGSGTGMATNPAALHPMAAYTDSSFQRRSQLWDHNVETFDPEDIEDDGDDGLQPPQQGRRSVLSFGRNKSRASLGSGAGAAGAAVAGGGLGAALGGLASRDASGRYSAVQTNEPGGGVGGPGGHADAEKSEWLNGQAKGKRKMTWIIGGIIAFLVIGGIVGGVVGGVVSSRNKKKTEAASTYEPDSDGLLDANSPQIQALMNNKDLHRVFPGMAYTPLNAQYPACLSNPVSQNNVTKDMAILSQLTNTIRLYGTDCNQTDLVLEAFSRLGLTDMRVWLAVWLDNNSTTNARGLNDMQDIIDRHGESPFEGVILGNEVLFREDLTRQQLLDIVSETRANFTNKKVNLPVAVADLGDNWTADMANDVDVVMSNVHPFFGGVPVDQGAGWAWDFWQTHDVSLTAGNKTKQNIISEIGWPSAGGNDCGEVNCTTSTEGAVSGISEMNTFMNDFVCQSLTNGTNYFWFEAFDEPWKVQFNTPGKEWEDKWGLMDADRNLKKGLTIPSCPGQSIPSR